VRLSGDLKFLREKNSLFFLFLKVRRFKRIRSPLSFKKREEKRLDRASGIDDDRGEIIFL